MAIRNKATDLIDLGKKSEVLKVLEEWLEYKPKDKDFLDLLKQAKKLN